MATGQMEIDGRVGEVSVPEKKLDGAKVSTGFQHVRGETVA